MQNTIVIVGIIVTILVANIVVLAKFRFYTNIIFVRCLNQKVPVAAKFDRESENKYEACCFVHLEYK